MVGLEHRQLSMKVSCALALVSVVGAVQVTIPIRIDVRIWRGFHPLCHHAGVSKTKKSETTSILIESRKGAVSNQAASVIQFEIA